MHSVLLFGEVSDNRTWLNKCPFFVGENNTNPGGRYCLGTRAIPEITADP